MKESLEPVTPATHVCVRPLLDPSYSLFHGGRLP
jgi:hypothetical protein